MKKLFILLAISLTSQIFAVDPKKAFVNTIEELSDTLIAAGRAGAEIGHSANPTYRQEWENKFNSGRKDAVRLVKELKQICNIK